MKTKIKDNSLKSEYSERLSKIDQQIIEIKGKLILHQEAFNKDANNWGYIGGLDRIEFLLNQINNFIKF